MRVDRTRNWQDRIGRVRYYNKEWIGQEIDKIGQDRIGRVRYYNKRLDRTRNWQDRIAMVRYYNKRVDRTRNW